jgi:hypothetical protein
VPKWNGDCVGNAADLPRQLAVVLGSHGSLAGAQSRRGLSAEFGIGLLVATVDGRPQVGHRLDSSDRALQAGDRILGNVGQTRAAVPV